MVFFMSKEFTGQEYITNYKESLFNQCFEMCGCLRVDLSEWSSYLPCLNFHYNDRLFGCQLVYFAGVCCKQYGPRSDYSPCAAV